MSDFLSIVVTQGRADIHDDAGNHLNQTAGASFPYDIGVSQTVRVKLKNSQNTKGACELHRSTASGNGTLCLSAERDNSKVKHGHFHSRPKERRAGTEIPGHKPGQKTHAKKAHGFGTHPITYTRGSLEVIIDV